jgi:hypothetical protein
MDGVTRSCTPPWGGALILRLTDWTVYNNLRGLEGKGFLHCNYGHCSVEKHTIHWHLHDWEYYIIPIASRDLITTFQSISWRKNPLIRVCVLSFLFLFLFLFFSSLCAKSIWKLSIPFPRGLFGILNVFLNWYYFDILMLKKYSNIFK